ATTSSTAFAVSPPLPGCHRPVERGLLGREKVRVMFYDVLTECAGGELARREPVGRFLQRDRQTGQMARRIHVAGKAFRRLDAIADSIEARREGRREREIRIAVGTRNPALNSQSGSAAHDAKRSRTA